MVSTDCPSGPREILSRVPDARLVPVGDPEALSGALLETLSRPRTPAPREAWERFTLPTAIANYLELIEQATSSGRKARL